MREAWSHFVASLAVALLAKHMPRMSDDRRRLVATRAALVIASHLPEPEPVRRPEPEVVALTTDESEWLMEMVRLRLEGQPISRAEGVQ